MHAAHSGQLIRPHHDSTERSPAVIILARALLFDLDGVLADSTASVERHWREWARRVGG